MGQAQKEISVTNLEELEYELNRVYGNDENTKRTIMILIKQELMKHIDQIRKQKSTFSNNFGHGGSTDKSFIGKDTISTSEHSKDDTTNIDTEV